MVALVRVYAIYFVGNQAVRETPQQMPVHVARIARLRRWLRQFSVRSGRGVQNDFERIMDDLHSVNQDATVTPVLWMGNLCVSNRSLQGVMKA